MIGRYSVRIDGKEKLIPTHHLEWYRARYPNMEVVSYLRPGSISELSTYDGGTEDWVRQLCCRLRKWIRKMVLANP